MLPAIDKITAQQTNPTEDTNVKAAMLVEYSYKYPNASLCHHASDIQLCTYYDATQCSN